MLTQTPSQSPGESPGESSGPTPIEVDDASVAIAGRPVLRGVDLTVRAGEFVALLGANGSGKTTLVRALTGLRPLVSGSVRLFGTPLPRFRDWHRVGFVPQRSGAGSGVPASVREVVISGRLSRRGLWRFPGSADRTAVTAALDAVGLGDRAGASVATLSGGQQQRVLIARALAGEPDLLLLDEPTAGVDVPSQQAFAETLGLLSARGATVVLVAHELGPLAPLVDRAVVMRHGKVAYDGPARAGELSTLVGGHDHHHGAWPGTERHDHAPHVGSPFERPGPEVTL